MVATRRKPWRVAITARLVAWSNDLDIESVKSGNTTSAYLVLAVFLSSIVWAGVYTEAGHSFLGYDSMAILAWQIPWVASGIALSELSRRDEVSRVQYWLLETICNGLGGLFLLVLAAHSKGISGLIPVSILLIACIWAAPLHRVTWRNPALVFCTAIAAATALPMVPENEPAAAIIVAAAAVGTMAVGLMLGSYSKRLYDEKSRTTKLDTAFRAQLLKEQMDNGVMSEGIMEASYYHDLSHNLQAALASLEIVKATLEVEEVINPQVEKRLDDLSHSLERVGELASEAKRSRGGANMPSVTAANVAPVVGDVVRRMSSLFPGVRIVVSPIADGRVQMLGGQSALSRVLENLVINACEGDGRERASEVNVSVNAPSDGGTIRLTVSDDGPGFQTADGNPTIKAYTTTKKNGVGLGLYTVDRIVRGSGGSVRCRNTTTGAAVVVTLPKAVGPRDERAEQRV